MKSPFSCAVHARPRTVLQFRPNHFSVLAISVKRLGEAETAIGSIAFPARVIPAFKGEAVWHDEHDGVSGPPALFDDL